MKRRLLTRRSFLKRAAATGGALALPTFIPASALGRGGAKGGGGPGLWVCGVWLGDRGRMTGFQSIYCAL